MYLPTTATYKLAKLRKRIRAVAGGTSAGKTISILQLLIDNAAMDKQPTLSSVVSETMPHLKRGAMRDFLSIIQAHGLYKEENWNRSDFTYTFANGSKIEFFSTDQPGKVRGPRRDRLFVNEGNNIDYESFDQLLVRTKEYAWVDWNPTSEFWMYTDVIPTREDVDFITLTYKDNEGLDPRIVADIESHMANKQWWQVYGLGQLGEVEGKIFKSWLVDLDEIPHEARLERRGLDFGYSNDPTCLVDVYRYNGGFIVDERLYQKNMSNKQIADLILNLEEPQITVYADSAEPKSIDELRLYGVNIMAANKGPGSINQGINYIQDQRISLTKRSTDLIREYRNYMWETDKDGRILNKPIDIFNHGMDALRYALETYSRNYGTKAGVVNTLPAYKPTESFLVDEEGNAINYNIDLLEAVKRSEQPEQDWRYV